MFSKFSWALILMLSTICTTAIAQDFYADYQSKAELLITQLEREQFEEAYKTLAQLKVLGISMVDLYSAKKPACKASGTIFKEDLKNMENLSVEEIEKLYHDGERFPNAPKNCYYGRTLLVHPIMNRVRVKNALANSSYWTNDMSTTALNEVNETIAYLPYIKSLLN